MYYKKCSFLGLILFYCLVAFSQNKQEKEIAIYAKPDSLYGTLLLGKSKFLCIFHSGSGPTDRNGNNSFGVETNYLSKLADSLYAHKISSFRYDKRGIGKSKDALESEDSLSIYTYVNDLLMWIDYFSKPPYKFKNFILIGHSEGALIVTLAAQKDKRVSKVILLSGAGYRADTLIKRQTANLHENARKIIYSMLDTLAAGKRIENVPPVLSMFFRESVQNYMISWLSIDPAVELSKLKIPALIIQGDNDIQVSVKDAERLHQHKKGAQLKIITGMNHILVDAPADKKSNFETYKNPDLPLSKELVPTIIQFLNK
ncbi:MAG TPA: alpha/beta hydrolase [Bacteroidia bacterium]|nr:alpha/beta hydrolase [Bacteroidia bacterium]